MCAVGEASSSVVAAGDAEADAAVEEWLRVVEASLEERSLVRLSLSGNSQRAKASAPAHLLGLNRVQGRLVQVCMYV